MLCLYPLFEKPPHKMACLLCNSLFSIHYLFVSNFNHHHNDHTINKYSIINVHSTTHSTLTTSPNSFQNPLTLKSPTPSHLKPLTSQINVCTAYDWNMIYSRIFALYQQQLKVTFHWQNMYFPYSYLIFSKIS